MILVDTSVWIDHLRGGDAELAAALNAEQVLAHPFVIGELACGNLSNRAEVLFFIERHALMGRGIGWVDAHLLSAASLAGTATLWTRDRRLLAVARALDLVH